MSDIPSDAYRPVRGTDDAPILPPALTRAAGAALFLVLVAGMALWAYRLGTRDAAEIPVIRAMEGPARIQPEDPGGLTAPHQGLEVNSVLAGEPAPSPRESAPDPAPPPVALAEEDGPQGELVVPVPEFAALAEPGEGEELRMPPQEAGPGESAGVAPDAAATVDALVAEALAAAGEDDAAAETGEAAAAEDVAALAPGPRPRGRPAGHVVRPPAPAQSQPRPAAPAEPAAPAASTASAPREVASVAPGSRLVQLGAFDNEALARQVWSQLSARHGDLLGGKSLFLERATHNARVFYRLRVAGFANTDQTRVLCEQLRARGVDCIPVTLQ